MENKVQKSEGKAAKKSAKASKKYVSIRIPVALKHDAKLLRDEANNKDAGRKIMLDEIIALGIGLVTKQHLKALQEQSLTHEDRKELLRQQYIELHGPISKDDWTGFTMTKEFHEFIAAQSAKPIAA